MSEKVILEAQLIFKKLLKAQIKEIASKLQLPENKQQDLLFMSAILVSTGTNKNGATFLGSELIKARETIAQKALDIEHDEQKIIGHIASALYMDQEGNLIDDQGLQEELASSEAAKANDTIKKLDAMSMDIGIVCIVYKDRFPDLAKEIESGDWKVSMECYYDDFDIKIGNLIIPRSLASTYDNLDKKISDKVKLVLAGKEEGDAKVSRVLRNIKFCGVGIVKNPANERSLILEAASSNFQETLEKEGLIVLSEVSAERSEENLNSNSPNVGSELDEVKNKKIDLKAGKYYLVKMSESGFEFIKNLPDSDYLSKKVIEKSEHWYKIFTQVCSDLSSDCELCRYLSTAVEENKDIKVEAGNEVTNLAAEENNSSATALSVESSAEVKNIANKVSVVAEQNYKIKNTTKEPFLSFPTITLQERKDLASEDFGLVADRKIPLHTEDAIKHAMAYFDALILPLTIKQRKDLFTNIIKKAVLSEMNTEYFEKSCLKHGLKYNLAGTEDLEFGIPRLGLLPLNSREQVLSAMSRFSFLKVEITDYERQHLVVNILRAAQKFGIDSSKFRLRVANNF